MPLVLTDGQGKDPVVVLPFDMYEALVLAGQESEKNEPESAETREPVIVPVKDDSLRTTPGVTQESSVERRPHESELAKPQRESDLLAELSVEERFYIDTIDNDKIG